MSNLVGRSIGRYHIIEKLGEGGMAAVYKAFDTRLERDVAIKVIIAAQQQSEMFLKRFDREAKALAKLTHANIVSVIDYGDEEGLPYLVMEFMPGGTLKQMMGKPHPFREAARLLAPVAWALEYAHQRGIIHRDVKPANVLMTESGAPMLSDFGIAKILDESGATQLTATGTGIGTPDYMSPEQSRGEAIDYRADIYSLGIVFYEMVTGRRPFHADTPMAVIYKHATEPLPRPRQFVPDLPEDVERVLYKALTKKPEDRYQTMRDFAVALEKLVVLSETSQPVPTKMEQPPVKAEHPQAEAAPSTKPEEPAAVPPIASVVSGVPLSKSDIPSTKSGTAPSQKVPPHPPVDTETALQSASHPAFQDAVTRTRPAGESVPSFPAVSQPFAPARAKKPWVWIAVGVGGLAMLCVAAVLAFSFIKPLRNLILGTETAPAQAEVQKTKTSTTRPARKTDTPQPEPGQGTDCSMEEIVCVAAMGSGPWDDNSFHQSIRIGIDKAATDSGIIPSYYTVEDISQPAAVLEKMAKAGNDIIISAGYQYSDAVIAAARIYPEIDFIAVDAFFGEDMPSNLVALIFHEDQAGFLAGALAGMMTQTNSVAAICGVDYVPAVWRYCEGFRAGALQINPGVRVEVAYYNGDLSTAFNNPDWGAEVTLKLIESTNADVFFTAAGATHIGVFKQAVEKQVYVIGVDYDQYFSTFNEVKPFLLSSAEKNITGGVYDLINLSMKSALPNGYWYGTVDIAPYHELEDTVPQGVKDKMISITEQIHSGELQTGVADSKDTQSSNVYKIATDPTYPPFEFINEAGDLVGFDIEMMKLIVQKENIQIEFVTTSFDQMLIGVKSCEYNAGLSAISFTNERAKMMLYSEPYYNDGQVILVRNNDTAVQGSGDLKGKRIAIVVGTPGQAVAEKFGAGEILGAKSREEAYEMLINRKVDVAILYRSWAWMLNRNDPSATNVLGEILTEDNYHLVACQKDEGLIKMFNEGLAQITADGTLEKIAENWSITGQ